MLDALRKITDEGPDSKTYRKVMYAREIQKELFRLFERPLLREIDFELRQIMYYLNYNSIHTVSYHTDYINSLLQDAETRLDKIERLSLVLKEISQAQVKPGLKFNLDAPPLKDQLINYVSEEMDYLERLHYIAGTPPVKPLDPLHAVKVKFDLSVAQLAYLVKVFIEVNVIQNKSLTELLRFLAKCAITKRAESISYDSVRAKYYNIEQSTKEAVKNMLLIMVRYIEND